MNIRKLLLLLLAICYAGSLSGSEQLENRVREIAGKLRCPTCQGMSVKESDAGLSMNMKQRIRELLQAGKSEDEILQFFVDRYGEWILRSPQKKGFSLLLWILPGLIIVVAVLSLLRYLKKRSRTAVAIDTSPLSDVEKRQIENDLKQI